MPTKIASRKNAKPSSVNARPNTAPKRPMNSGQSRPNSNESTVPDTAPTANNTAKTFDQRRANSRHTASPVASQRHSAASSNTGIPTPNTASMMCAPSVSAICHRAQSKLSGSTADAINASVSIPAFRGKRSPCGRDSPDATTTAANSSRAAVRASPRSFGVTRETRESFTRRDPSAARPRRMAGQAPRLAVRL